MKYYILLILLVPSISYAYLDPASLTLAFQLVVGVVAGAFGFFKLYWRKTKGIFSKSEDTTEEVEINKVEKIESKNSEDSDHKKAS